jgi:hypothetical protein
MVVLENGLAHGSLHLSIISVLKGRSQERSLDGSLDRCRQRFSAAAVSLVVGVGRTVGSRGPGGAGLGPPMGRVQTTCPPGKGILGFDWTKEVDIGVTAPAMRGRDEAVLY